MVRLRQATLLTRLERFDECLSLADEAVLRLRELARAHAHGHALQVLARLSAIIVPIPRRHANPDGRGTGQAEEPDPIRSGKHVTPALFADIRSALSSVASGRLARIASSR